MKTKKTGNPKYPLEATLDDGTKLIIPRQSQFDNEWLRKHGCSLMAEYIALQFLGVTHMAVHGRLVKVWPLYLHEWHKVKTPEDIYAKVTVKGVSKGIDILGKGKGCADYITTPTEERIQAAIDSGYVVILEQGNPIHTVTLLPDKKGIYVANAGTVRRTTAKAKAKKATTSKRYRGMVIVKRSEK